MTVLILEMTLFTDFGHIILTCVMHNTRVHVWLGYIKCVHEYGLLSLYSSDMLATWAD